jgi:hypothetical protein
MDLKSTGFTTLIFRKIEKVNFLRCATMKFKFFDSKVVKSLKNNLSGLFKHNQIKKFKFFDGDVIK